jgi:excisionase family DNA binding protein
MNSSLPEYFESMNRALTAGEVAKLLAIKRDTIYLYAKAGELPSINIGARKTLLRFDPMTLAQWIRERQSDMQEQRAEGAKQ